MQEDSISTKVLYVVPTPIGNLEDITLRAINTLKKVPLILAEDTRHFKKLMQHFDIQAELKSYHMHNEHKKLPGFIELFDIHNHIALVSDAGTPGISDPGYLLIKACIENQIKIVTLPGPTAFLPALVSSGFPCDRFLYEGFLPHKKGRQKRWDVLKKADRTIVLYESTYRIEKLLAEIADHLGPDHPICVGKEISKIHENYFRGTVSEVQNNLTGKSLKGEFVVVIKMP